MGRIVAWDELSLFGIWDELWLYDKRQAGGGWFLFWGAFWVIFDSVGLNIFNLNFQAE